MWVCGQCGETYFEGPEVHQIQEAVKTLGPKAPKIQVRSRNRWTLSDSDAPVDGRMPWLVVLFVLFWVFYARSPSADLPWQSRASGEILKCGDCPVYGEDGVDGGKGGR